MKLNIEQVITGRLQLQNTERALTSNWGLNVSTIKDLQSPGFIKKWASWNDEKKRSFAHLLGGPINEARTLKFIEKNITQIA